MQGYDLICHDERLTCTTEESIPSLGTDRRAISPSRPSDDGRRPLNSRTLYEVYIRRNVSREDISKATSAGAIIFLLLHMVFRSALAPFIYTLF